MFTYHTPLIPLSFKGEGEEILERGEASLRLLLLWGSSWEVLEGHNPSKEIILFFLLSRGRG